MAKSGGVTSMVSTQEVRQVELDEPEARASRGGRDPVSKKKLSK